MFSIEIEEIIGDRSMRWAVIPPPIVRATLGVTRIRQLAPLPYTVIKIEFVAYVCQVGLCRNHQSPPYVKLIKANLGDFVKWGLYTR